VSSTIHLSSAHPAAAAGHLVWTDYASAIGSIIGILVAAAALLVAARSARDASSSAKSAERTAEASATTLEAATAQLELAKQEHERLEAERARRPSVNEISLSEIQARPGEQAPAGVFRIGFTNRGNTDLQAAVLTIMFDPGSAAVLVDRWANLEHDQSRDETHERWPGPDGVLRAFDYFARHVSASQGVSRLQYVCFPRRGRFPIRIKLFSASLGDLGPWVDKWIEIDEEGRASVVDLAGEPERYAGRLSQFDPTDD
jgi:hypothetical protein